VDHCYIYSLFYSGYLYLKQLFVIVENKERGSSQVFQFNVSDPAATSTSLLNGDLRLGDLKNVTFNHLRSVSLSGPGKCYIHLHFFVTPMTLTNFVCELY